MGYGIIGRFEEKIEREDQELLWISWGKSRRRREDLPTFPRYTNDILIVSCDT